MRTTIRIDDALYRKVKARAAQTGRTVGDVIEDAVRAAMRPRSRQRAELRPLPVFGGSGLMPGVDLTSNETLRELMDTAEPLDALR